MLVATAPMIAIVLGHVVVEEQPALFLVGVSGEQVIIHMAGGRMPP